MVIATNLSPPAAQPAAETGPVEGCGFVKGVLFSHTKAFRSICPTVFCYFRFRFPK